MPALFAFAFQAAEPAADSVTSWSSLGGELLSAAIAALLGFLIFAIRAFRPLLQAWIDAQIGKIEDEKTRERVSIARDQVESAVYSVSQTMVPKVREAAEDGKITPEERQKLLDEAREKTMGAFDADFWEDLADRLGLNEENLKRWLEDEIEARVFRMKMARGE